AEVRRRLSRIENMQVIPYYEPHSKSPVTALKTGFSLDGHLQGSGGTIRFTVELTDNSSGALVWSEDFERYLDDPLQLQSEIAFRAVDAMHKRMTRTALNPHFPYSSSALDVLWPVRRWIAFQLIERPDGPTSSRLAMQ